MYSCLRQPRQYRGACGFQRWSCARRRCQQTVVYQQTSSRVFHMCGPVAVSESALWASPHRKQRNRQTMCIHGSSSKALIFRLGAVYHDLLPQKILEDQYRDESLSGSVRCDDGGPKSDHCPGVLLHHPLGHAVVYRLEQSPFSGLGGRPYSARYSRFLQKQSHPGYE